MADCSQRNNCLLALNAFAGTVGAIRRQPVREVPELKQFQSNSIWRCRYGECEKPNKRVRSVSEMFDWLRKL